MLRPFNNPNVLDAAVRKDNRGCSRDQTDAIIERYLQRVSLARESLHTTSLLFLGTRTVLPAYCNKAINSLEEIGELIQEFCEFLRPTLSVSCVSSAPYYHLLCALYAIKKRISDLSDLINSYIPSYQQPRAPFAAKQRHYISHSFKELLQYTADLPLQEEQAGEDDEALAREFSPASVLYLPDYQNKRPQIEN